MPFDDTYSADFEASLVNASLLNRLISFDNFRVGLSTSRSSENGVISAMDGLIVWAPASDVLGLRFAVEFASVWNSEAQERDIQIEKRDRERKGARE